jgi:hypothetical protein
MNKLASQCMLWLNFIVRPWFTSRQVATLSSDIHICFTRKGKSKVESEDSCCGGKLLDAANCSFCEPKGGLLQARHFVAPSISFIRERRNTAI